MTTSLMGTICICNRWVAWQMKLIHIPTLLTNLDGVQCFDYAYFAAIQGFVLKLIYCWLLLDTSFRCQVTWTIAMARRNWLLSQRAWSLPHISAVSPPPGPYLFLVNWISAGQHLILLWPVYLNKEEEQYHNTLTTRCTGFQLLLAHSCR